MSRRILIIYTGGTIGMIKDPESGILRPFDLDRILRQVPELSTFGYTLDAQAFKNPIDSSNMQPSIWLELAGIIEKNYVAYDGFVILHGSDTMAYTASALSFLLENLAKSVVLTGSQLPIGHVRTDAKENLITSIEIAAAVNTNGSSRVPEVCLYFDYQLYRGNRVIKYNAEKFKAFHSPNHAPLAEAGIRIRYHDNYILPIPKGAFKVHHQLRTEVGSLKLFPGMSLAVFQAILRASDLKVLILEGYGAGNGPTEAWFLDGLAQFIQSGKTVMAITQCNGGSVDLGKYETSARMLAIGVISGNDLTFEASVTKAMFLLGQGFGGQQLENELQRPVCGELSKF